MAFFEGMSFKHRGGHNGFSNQKKKRRLSSNNLAVLPFFR
jgi:hypothetical protein